MADPPNQAVPPSADCSLGRHQRAFEAALKKIQQENFVSRIWAKDPSLWHSDAAHHRLIQQSLGWLTVAETMQERVTELSAFADEIRRVGFTRAVLAGMGGSSLCPEVCRSTFGAAAGFLDLQVLDSTDPAAVARVEKKLRLAKTLFIIASKSGTTTETLSHFKYFYAKVREAVDEEKAGAHFIAITDRGTPLEALAREKRFRRVFINPSDIGGRYSALSYFGLVPAALLGVEVTALLANARSMMRACAPNRSVHENPGARLGAVLGALALQGRDKLTLVMSSPLASLGAWIEQLVAESTGKEGKGILPVNGEALGRPEDYADDRLFVHVQLRDPAERDDSPTLEKMSALGKAGHPVVRLLIDKRTDLGGEFFRWEFATAVAGALLGVNPFDQPNVQESKDNTKKILELFEKEGKRAEPEPSAQNEKLRVFSGTAANGSANSVTVLIQSHLRRVRRGDYIAFTVYCEPAPPRESFLERIRVLLRNRLRVATTVGYGPRYLHSTGQLHKGGANNGVFLHITTDDPFDLAIPSEPYTFGSLKAAQAAGDFESLLRHGRRVLRVHIATGGDVESGLDALEQLLDVATQSW